MVTTSSLPALRDISSSTLDATLPKGGDQCLIVKSFLRNCAVLQSPLGTYSIHGHETRERENLNECIGHIYKSLRVHEVEYIVV